MKPKKSSVHTPAIAEFDAASVPDWDNVNPGSPASRYLSATLEHLSRNRKHWAARSRCERVSSAGRQAAREARMQITPEAWAASTTGLEKALLKVEASRCEHGDDYAVEVQWGDSPGNIASLFASSGNVVHRGRACCLIVFVLPHLQEAKILRVLLPATAFEVGSRWIDVPASTVFEQALKADDWAPIEA